MSGYVVQLDPPAVATGRTMLDLNSGAIRLDQSSVSWGDAAIQAYLSDARWGSSAVDYRVPNRTVTIPLGLGMDDSGTEETVRAQLQQKVALLQRDGGWLLRQRAGGPAMYADIVDASLTLPDVWGEAGGVEDKVVLTLTCLPDFYGDEVTLDTLTATGVLVSKLKASSVDAVIAGDYPARCRIIASDTSGNDQHGLLWGLRSRHYDSASTAALSYEAEALTPITPAATTTLAGSSGGSVVRNASLPAGIWAPTLSTDISGTGPLTHQGSYRAWARVYSGSSNLSNLPQLRLLWAVGDLGSFVTNAAVQIPTAGRFYLLDLGAIRVDAPPTGTCRWKGVIQAYATNQGDPVSIDAIYLQPVDEGGGLLGSTFDADQGAAQFSALDKFTESAGGNLTGATAMIGGNWSGAGNASDFLAESASLLAQRTHVSDSSAVGRFETLGSSMGATVVQVDMKSDVAPDFMGVLARFASTSNVLQGQLVAGTALAVQKYVAGSRTVLASVSLTSGQWTAGAWYTMRLATDTSGRYWLWWGPQGGPLALFASGQDTDLATGGALASGTAGMYDERQSGVAATRQYANFAAWAPTADAAVFANRSAELRTDGMFRQDSSGAVYVPSTVEGDLPRLPASGIESRPVELFVRPSRGELDPLPDSGLDGLSVQVKYRPCWLSRP